MNLHCEFKQKPWKGYDFLYTCIVTSVTIKEPNTIIKAVKGNHLSGKTNKDVKAILFQCMTVKYLPGNLAQLFPQLRIFWIKTCGLKAISPTDLNGLVNVAEFNADYNELKSLPSNVFTNMKKLKKVSFFGNKLKYVSSESFEAFMLHRVKSIDLRKNTKIDAIYDAKEPDTIPLRQLMQLIDTQCAKPTDKDFNLSLSNISLKEELSEKFLKLKAINRLSDFTIVTRGAKEIPVHQNVLAIQSSVFAACFKKDEMKCESRKITIDDTSAVSVEHFIEYFYTGQMKDDYNAVELFVLAAKYDVSRLKTICLDLLFKDLDESNAYELFSLGHLYSCESLKEKAFDEIKKMFPDRQISNRLMNRFDDFKELLDAHRNFKQKIQEAQEEFDKAWQHVPKMP